MKFSRSAPLAIILPGLAIAAVIGGEAWVGKPEAPDAHLSVQLPRAGYGPANQDAASQMSAQRMAYGTEIVRRGEDGWLSRQVLARAMMQSFAVDGKFDMLSEAGNQLRLSQDNAIDGSGPFLTTAEWAMSVHDLDLTARSLDGFDNAAVVLTATERAAAHALRGDVAFYRGDTAAAESAYREGAEIENGPAILVRQSIVAKSKGDFDRAITLLTDAARTDSVRTPQSLANIALQAGAIEFARGNYSRGSRWYAVAEKVFPGYWKTDLYLGEAALVAGDAAMAAKLFQRVVDHNNAPEAMDALAMLHRSEGNRAESLRWSRSAAQEWDRRVSELPSAAIAHAAEHELAFGDPQRALALASTNLSERPYGDARILMAKAHTATGEPQKAVEQLDLALASGWRSAMLFVELARAYEALGESEKADEARERAVSLNPKILEPEASRVWIAHG